ncbi:MAG: potassium transporter TrkG [bacterium]
MNKKFIIYSIGRLLEILSYIVLIPAAIAFFEINHHTILYILRHSSMLGFNITIIASFVCGTILKNFGQRELIGSGIKEGFAIVTFGWLALTLFGCIPLMVYFLSHVESISLYTFTRAFTNAYFEIMSGFTTTGATIIPNVELLPRGILFWRSLTHWLGGMGIITLVLAILPVFGIAGYQMFRGEVPGPTTEQLKPRLAETAKILWGTYVLLTLIETILLSLGGMPVFDAVCHAFGTMATGGFSTKNASIGYYHSAYIEWVIIAFMFCAGMNFIIHYLIIFKQKFNVLTTNREFIFYSSVIIIATFLTAGILQIDRTPSKDRIMRSFRNKPLSSDIITQKIKVEKNKLNTLHDRIRHSVFQVVSITTTTGYTTADFDMWPNFIRYMLVILMFFGGCAGSTGGGMKMIRIMVIIKGALREIRTIIQPRIIAPIKIAKRTIEERQVSHIWGFVALFGALFVIFSLIMSFIIDDFATSFTSIAATMCNIGPGLSGVGAVENYNWIPLGGKWILILSMLLGRLEIYTVLIAFSPITWKK